MKMNAQTVGWLVVLALIQNFSCNLFTLEESKLTAKEGSCIEIKCRVHRKLNYDGLYWFWMKNANWIEALKDFNATIIYSTDNSLRPVSPEFAGRVTYTGSPFSSWAENYKSTPMPECSILICNLTKTDSGKYSFRYVGSVSSEMWETNKVNLTVEENPCPITFETPPVVNESGRITLTCSTLPSCPSNPQIQDLTEWSSTERSQQIDKEQKSTKASFTANWQDDGKKFSCQTGNNTDTHLIRNVSVTVEYAPKEIVAKISPENIKEGQSVTLTCAAKGNPVPTFTWYNNDHQMHSGPEWKITSIDDSQSGKYHCKAHNIHGNISNPVVINVLYKPQVEVKMTSSASVVYQGDEITLTCHVMRSKPEPTAYFWYKDETLIGEEQMHVFKAIKPKDRGNYTCNATNTVGEGQSQPFEIDVKYSPMKATISISEHVRVGKPLTFTCLAEANPAPVTYFWHRFSKTKPTDSPQWTYKTTNKGSLHLESVQRADEACYVCNATNDISTGEDSEPMCIQVHYPPTNTLLSMDAEVIEDQLINISCTVESFPQSRLTLTRTSTSNSQASEWNFSQHDYYEKYNTLNIKFNVTLTDTGLYTCNAENNEGLNKSMERKLVVKYRPRDVTVQAKPDLVVKETTQLILNCSARAYPPVTSVTWIKVTDGKSEIIKNWNGTIKSVNASDSGLYSCEASNKIGTGKSQQVEVKVKYAPKHIKIIRAAEQHSDGKSFVKLSCSAQSYPPVTHYSWYKKTKEVDTEVSANQNYTVNSDQPGEYYCIAKNEINQSSSDSVPLFVNRGLIKALSFFILVIISLLIIILILFVYRRKRNKSVQQETTNTLPFIGFLSWWNGPGRRNLMNEQIMAEPSRSRDDLLPDQPCRPKAQRRQLQPDSTPASNISSVYCTVNLPAGKQGPSAQKPIKQQGGHTEADSLNYANFHFGNKQKNKPENVVYAMVYQKKQSEKNEEGQEEYENFSAVKNPNPLDYDTDTSEDEVDLNYTQVNFTAKPGHQRASRDSSSSDEEKTQYSEVKI